MIDGIVEKVVDKFRTRSIKGISTYNTTLEANNKDNYLVHLQEELMDGCNYIQKLIEQDREITQLIKKYPNDASLGEKIRELIK